MVDLRFDLAQEVPEPGTGREWGDVSYSSFSLHHRHLHIATSAALVPVCKYTRTQKTQLTKHAIFIKEAQLDTEHYSHCTTKDCLISR